MSFALPAGLGQNPAAVALGIAALGLLYFVASPYLSGDARAEKRRQAVAAPRAKRIGNEAVFGVRTNITF